LSTGEFTTAEYPGPDGPRSLADELLILRPRELLLPEQAGDPATLLGEGDLQGRLTTVDGWAFDLEPARRALVEQLRTHSLDGYGLEGHPAAIRAAGALVHYLRDTQKTHLAHVREIAFRTAADCLLVDPTTMRNLEVVESCAGTRSGSLLDELDRTVTPMGGRMLRAWLLRPLLSLERIHDRLDAVEELAYRSTERAKLRDAFKIVHDIERLVGRAAMGTAGPRDLVSLRQSLTAIPRVQGLLGELQAPLVRSLVAELDDLTDVREALDAALVEEPPALARDGGAIRDGVDAELDELRTISRSGKQRIAEMEDGERARTGIGSLKIRYNRVFGYYIEISKSNLASVPADYRRKQTIAGGERFITRPSRTTRRRCSAPTRRSSSASWRSSRPCGPAWGKRRRASRTPPGRWPPSTCSARSPTRRRPSTTPSR
jgi:DNA mismatch repair protein MutS